MSTEKPNEPIAASAVVATAVPPVVDEPKVDVVARHAAATQAAATVQAVAANLTGDIKVGGLSHVLVPVATLQAIHATLASHADTILALLPKTTPEQVDEALKLMTASRLKQQVAGK